MKIILSLLSVLFVATVFAILEERELRLKELENLDQGEKEK